MKDSIKLTNVITYKPYFSYLFILILSVAVFFLYSQLFYVQPGGLMVCLIIVLLIYIWSSFLLSEDLELSIVGDDLVITSRRRSILIKLNDITGLYFHDEDVINQSDLLKKGLASSLKIYYGNGKVFEANEYSSLFMAERYDQQKNLMFRNFLNALLIKLDFKRIKKSKFRSFSNSPAAWYAKSI